MTALTIIQDAENHLGLNVSSAVVETLDNTGKLMLSLLNREGRHLAAMFHFNELVRTATHTTLAAEDQGALSSICTDGFSRIIPDTMYDTTSQEAVAGPASPAGWRYQKAMGLTGPQYRFRIVGDHLRFYPTPPAGHTVTFEYLSKNWCTDSAATPQEAVLADDDIPLLDHELLVEGVILRYLNRNGLPADASTYYQRLNALIRADKAAGAISAEGASPRLVGPGLFVPRGPW